VRLSYRTYMGYDEDDEDDDEFGLMVEIEQVDLDMEFWWPMFDVLFGDEGRNRDMETYYPARDETQGRHLDILRGHGKGDDRGSLLTNIARPG
jgi:hypothetical protein